MSDKGKIVIISGPSAAGKGMVVQVLIDKYRYETVVQTTDRKKGMEKQKDLYIIL